MKVYAASAVVPMASHQKAIEIIHQGLADENLGPLSSEKIQVCPQHTGYINDDLIGKLIETYPGTEFRLHASPKIRETAVGIFHVSNASENMDYFRKADEINTRFKATGYSIHAGERGDCTIDEMIDKLDMIQQQSNTVIAVEGLYPTKSNRWLMSSWEEYERVAERGCRYALDLSHLNIVARYHGRNDRLVENLLASRQCIEVHVSENDGKADSHKPLKKGDDPWWKELLAHSNPEAAIFYEGVLVDPRERRGRRV